MPPLLLDVTKIEPRLKHPTIVQHFDALAPGESFIIYNDHDPKPLYYQLLGERGEVFNWEYLEQGPEIWRVQIARHPQTGAAATTETVGSISAKDWRKAEAFKKMGIDFCCGGNKTLDEASAEAGIAREELDRALAEADKQSATGPTHQYDQWDPGFLADYIVQTHHRYIKENAELLTGLSEKVTQHHGANHPELTELHAGIVSCLDDMRQHMIKEERVLFPAIKELEAAVKEPHLAPLKAGRISQPIHVMEAEHEHSGAD